MRTELDFSLKKDEIISQINKGRGSISPGEMAALEEKGWLEWRLIDGEKKYFSRAVTNMLLLKKFSKQKTAENTASADDPDMKFRLRHTTEIYRSSSTGSEPVIPVKMKITYSIMVHSDVVPAGELIRCWLPYPKENNKRQKLTELLTSSEKEYQIAPDSSIHRTIYMEKVAEKGSPAIFKISYTYQSSGQYLNQSDINALPYNRNSDLFTKYTQAQAPHINFSESVRKLADSLTTTEDDPKEIVRKIYFWFKHNIPWTGALEYSVIPDIPEYVYQNRRGDCGMQTFMFMSMLRYKGIPVRWQSGWMLPPGAENLHDWCEVYFEGTGWLPVDISYDLQKSDITGVREFYLSGIDSYRLIVNDGIAGPLHPEKIFMRSEPFDFQRGEVEWAGGNLYFNKWDYNMTIEYL